MLLLESSQIACPKGRGSGCLCLFYVCGHRFVPITNDHFVVWTTTDPAFLLLRYLLYCTGDDQHRCCVIAATMFSFFRERIWFGTYSTMWITNRPLEMIHGVTAASTDDPCRHRGIWHKARERGSSCGHEIRVAGGEGAPSCCLDVDGKH